MNKDVEDMDKSGCNWPDCVCQVPYWAFSHHNRVPFCAKLKEYRQQQSDKDVDQAT